MPKMGEIMEKRTTDRRNENWISKYWRPAMAWQYFIICMFDFMLAPIGLAIYSAARHIDYLVWLPLTLQGGGLYHLSMGAIIGVATWSRGNEKLAIMAQTTPEEK